MLVDMPPVQTVGKIETVQIPHLKVSVKYLIPSNAQVLECHSSTQIFSSFQVPQCLKCLKVQVSQVRKCLGA